MRCDECGRAVDGLAALVAHYQSAHRDDPVRPLARRRHLTLHRGTATRGAYRQVPAPRSGARRWDLRGDDGDEAVSS